MSTISERIHFYYNGHTYEIEPAKLNHGDAWYNATGLAHGAAEEGTLLSQLYDSAHIATTWSQWNLIKTADAANDDGTINYWQVGVEDINVVENTVENEDGSSVVTYSSDKVYPDGTVVRYSYEKDTNTDKSGTIQEKWTYPDGRVVEQNLTFADQDGVSTVTGSDTATTLSNGSTIDFPESSASRKKVEAWRSVRSRAIYTATWRILIARQKMHSFSSKRKRFKSLPQRPAMAAIQPTCGWAARMTQAINGTGLG